MYRYKQDHYIMYKMVVSLLKVVTVLTYESKKSLSTHSTKLLTPSRRSVKLAKLATISLCSICVTSALKIIGFRFIEKSHTSTGMFALSRHVKHVGTIDVLTLAITVRRRGPITIS